MGLGVTLSEKSEGLAGSGLSGHDPAAQAAVKEERKERQAAVDESHEKNKHQDETIRLLTQKVEQMIQQQLKVAV